MIEGSNFNIRHVSKCDLGRLVSLLNNATLRGAYLPENMVSPGVLERKFAENSLSTEDRETLLIVDKQDNILGSITYFRSVPYFSAFEIGYGLFSLEHRGSGITTEAIRLISSYLFKTKLINRLEIRMDAKNIASERVAIKCGYRKEGVSRAANFVQGKYVDMNVYALLRQEWEERFNPDLDADARGHHRTGVSA